MLKLPFYFLAPAQAVSSNLFHLGEVASILRLQQMAPSQIFSLGFLSLSSPGYLGFWGQLWGDFLHSPQRTQLTTQTYLPDRNNDCRHFGDTLLSFLSPNHIREILCSADSGTNLCTIGTNQAFLSWNTGLPRLCPQDGLWTPRRGHIGSSGQWLGSALPAVTFSLVLFLLTLFSIVPGAHFRGHTLVSTCRTLQAAKPAKWTWIFLTCLGPACSLLYFPPVATMPTLDNLDPSCLPAVQATPTISSQVASRLGCFLLPLP